MVSEEPPHENDTESPAGRHAGTAREGRNSSPDRAVTEILGYALIFALILATVGFVSFIGLPQLEQIQETEKAANAERAFDVVGDNMAAVYERNVPSRSTEIDLGGSQLYYGANISMTVDVDGTEVAQRKFRPVILEPNDQTTIIFEGGAVFRNQSDGGVVLRESPMLLRNNRVHVPIVQTTAAALESAGGTTVLLRGESTARSVATADRDGASTVTITIENTARYELWERHLEAQSGVAGCSVDSADRSVECEINDVDSVYVTVQQIELSLIT
jgi:hypothetical protein